MIRHTEAGAGSSPLWKCLVSATVVSKDQWHDEVDPQPRTRSSSMLNLLASWRSNSYDCTGLFRIGLQYPFIAFQCSWRVAHTVLDRPEILVGHGNSLRKAAVVLVVGPDIHTAERIARAAASEPFLTQGSFRTSTPTIALAPPVMI